MKTCLKCKITKPYKDFNPSNWGDGYRATCKKCRSIHESKSYYQDNKDKIKKQRKGKYLKYSKDYYESHKDYFEKYRLQNQEHYTKWRKENRKKLNEYRNNKMKTDIGFRISANLRSRLSTLLSRNKFEKSNSTLKLLGCTLEELKLYLESKFQKGMTWENYGEWHIDHIKACSKFDLSKSSEQKKCFHYSNLQPLWKVDNLKKNKY